MKRPNSSMQLTRAADYAVRVMIHLSGSPGDERVALPELAEATDAPESFLSKVLQALSRAGLISSRRGQLGGFQISPHGRTASMLDVIEATDGPICLNVCLVSGRSCHRKAQCPAHPVWARAQAAMLEVLSGAMIGGLASEARPAKAEHAEQMRLASGMHCACPPAWSDEQAQQARRVARTRPKVIQSNY